MPDHLIVSAPGAHPLATLSVALVFAAIFLVGGRVTYQPGQKGRRRFLSFAAGVSVAYMFVHVLPALHAIREFQTHSPNPAVLFPAYGVYLWTMVGFLVFYGLETMAAAQPVLIGAVGHAAGGSPQRPWLHMAGFALYTSILTYMMVWTAKDGLALGLFALAMGLHLFTIASNLGSHYREAYRRGGAMLALASLAGWGAAETLQLPIQWVLNLVAFVCGGVVVNAAIAELPREKEGRYWAFLTGAASYTALLLILSHVEEAM